ncbi:MAG: DoxX family protein [Cyclobacteriaceae bacterium]
MKHAKTILIWVIGISFIIIGILKYANLDEMSKGVIAQAHLPRWIIYIIGAIEFIGGILMLMTASTSKKLGTILIAFVMVGAIGTRLLLREPYSHFLLPGAILLIAILTLWTPRWRER